MKVVPMEGALSGKRVLVVEDEYFIASDLKRALEDEGAIPVGPVGRLHAALNLAAGELDLALLDVNLSGDTSYAIADELVERGVPYLFLTGYDGWSLPPAYRAAPRASKPFVTAQVMEMLQTLIEP